MEPKIKKKKALKVETRRYCCSQDLNLESSCDMISKSNSIKQQSNSIKYSLSPLWE